VRFKNENVLSQGGDGWSRVVAHLKKPGKPGKIGEFFRLENSWKNH